MKEEGIKEILKFGIAFTGKKVCIKTGKEISTWKGELPYKDGSVYKSYDE